MISNCLTKLIPNAAFIGRRTLAASSSDIDVFKKLLGEKNVKTEDLDMYNQDFLKMHQGKSPAVVWPTLVSQVSSVLSYCNSKLIQCVVQGGNTSLVAGAVPTKDEVIISLSKLNNIESFNETSGILRCQSGCVLQPLEEFVNEKGYQMPYDLGAKGSCQIGGNLSTNAGGLRYIRHGSLHGSVLGVEVVLADGRVLDLMSDMRKDNTGLDLKQLFIGAEGSLGVITRVSILCPLKPSAQTVGIFSLKSFEDVLKAFFYFRKELNEYVSAFEMMDSSSMDSVVNNLSLPHPFGESHPFYILIELSSNDSSLVENRLADVLEKLMNDGVVVDGTFSSDLTNMRKLWGYRERINESLMRDGFVYKYDVSLPLNAYYNIVEEMRRRLAQTATVRVVGYGHLGDSNLHLNVTSKHFDQNIQKLLEPHVFELVAAQRGSISAEHGLGLKKRQFLHYSKSQEAIAVMKQLKKLFDPNGILNPGKFLPD